MSRLSASLSAPESNWIQKVNEIFRTQLDTGDHHPKEYFKMMRQEYAQHVRVDDRMRESLSSLLANPDEEFK